MSRIEGPGGTSGADRLTPPDKAGSKKKPKKAFGDVLKGKEAEKTDGEQGSKVDPDDKGGRQGTGEQGSDGRSEMSGKTGGVGSDGKPLPNQQGGPAGKKPGDTTGKEGQTKFALNQETVDGARQMKQVQKGEVDKSESLQDQSNQAVGQQQHIAGVSNEATQIQEAKSAQLPPELMKRIVDTVRVGQNRVGATEMQIGLKSTVYEGMNLKVSSKDGIVNVVMEVEQLVAKDKLEAQLSDLQERLQDQGLAVGEISVELKGSGGGGGGGGDTSGDDQPQAGGSGKADSTGVEGTDRTPRKPDTSTDYTL